MDSKTISGSDILKYREEADTFSLDVIYSGEKVLFTLKDYTDWIVYEKTYNENDIGKQIHKKIELIDLCCVFSPVVNQDDQSTQKKQIQGKQFKTYIFGRVAENSNGPAYKIENKGKITIYTNVTYFRANQEIRNTFQSVLYLQKVRKIEDIQIFTIKADLQKKQFNLKIVKQIDSLKLDNFYLKKKLNDLQEQKNEMKYIINKLQTNLKKSQQQQLELKQYISIIKQQLLKSIKPQKTVVLPIDISCPYYNQYVVGGNMIKRINNNGTRYQIILNEVIPKDKIYSFKIKFTNVGSRDITVGIIDKKAGKNNQHSQGQAYAIAYQDNTGKLFPNFGNQGGGIVQGEILEVVVDSKRNKVQFKVDEKVRATATNCTILIQQNRQFVPYLQTVYTDNYLEWLGSEKIDN